MLDPELLEAAIRRDDSAAVRDLLKDATESDRAASAKVLKEFLRGPKWPDEPIMIMLPEQFAQMMRAGRQPELPDEIQEQQAERRREYDQWQKVANTRAFQLAGLGLAGGVTIAAKLASDFPYMRTSKAEIQQVAEVLADRRPAWLADFMDRHLKLWGQYPLGIPAWPLARALVRLGAISRPDAPEYTTLMPSGAQWDTDSDDKGRVHQRWPPPTPAQALLADPGLLEDEVWRLFTVPDAGKALADQDRVGEWSEVSGWTKPKQTWAQGLAELCADGHLDRDRLLDACLDAFTHDFNPNRVAWYVGMLGELKPSIPETSARVSKYLGLLAATSKSGVAVGQQGLQRLLKAGLLDADQLMRASAPALLFPQKSVAVAQLKLVGNVAAKFPAARPQAAATVAIAFGHERQDIQEAALALITKLGVPDGPPLAQVRLHAIELSPSLARQAVALGLLPGAPGSASDPEPQDAGAHPVLDVGLTDELAELEKRINGLPPEAGRKLTAALELVHQGNVPGPARVQPAAGTQLPPPVTDPAELIELFTVLIEDARDPIAAERALAGAVRLSSLPASQRRRLAAPLLKRTERVMRDYSPFYGDLIHIRHGDRRERLGRPEVACRRSPRGSLACDRSVRRQRLGSRPDDGGNLLGQGVGSRPHHRSRPRRRAARRAGDRPRRDQRRDAATPRPGACRPPRPCGPRAQARSRTGAVAANARRG
jgi:hypothetical protein